MRHILKVGKSSHTICVSIYPLLALCMVISYGGREEEKKMKENLRENYSV